MQNRRLIQRKLTDQRSTAVELTSIGCKQLKRALPVQAVRYMLADFMKKLQNLT